MSPDCVKQEGRIPSMREILAFPRSNLAACWAQRLAGCCLEVARQTMFSTYWARLLQCWSWDHAFSNFALLQAIHIFQTKEHCLNLRLYSSWILAHWVQLDLLPGEKISQVTRMVINSTSYTILSWCPNGECTCWKSWCDSGQCKTFRTGVICSVNILHKIPVCPWLMTDHCLMSSCNSTIKSMPPTCPVE